jgi:hypothetical protein
MYFIEEPSVCQVQYLTCKIFLPATCTLDEPDKHFSHKLLLYFAFFVKWVKSLTCIVKKLFAFFSKEKATKKPIVSFDRVYQRTSKALGVSYTLVHRIMNGKRPCKSNRPKERAKILDDFDHCVIKRSINVLYSRKIAPTVSIIHKEIKDSIKISKSKLTLTLIDLGYTYKKK